MDFTLGVYKRLLEGFKAGGYGFQGFGDFLRKPEGRVVVLRHDVDKRPQNALETARIEHGLGIRGSYYFRVVPGAWDAAVMRQVADLGHELGYHCEDLVIARGDFQKAVEHFKERLERFRQIYPVKTICMHGSPMSRYNERELWKRYDYREFGIAGEPYFDVDFKKVFYLTDTGRKWNNTRVSLRDRVDSGFDIPVKDSFHLMALASGGRLPEKAVVSSEL
jgi:hypothetical protein